MDKVFGLELEDSLREDAIVRRLSSSTEQGAIEELAYLASEIGLIDEKETEDVLAGVMKRQALGGTALPSGVAIPHAKCHCVKDSVILVGLSEAGIMFNAASGPSERCIVRMVVLVITAADKPGQHLRVLSSLVKLLRQSELSKGLLALEHPSQIRKALIASSEQDIAFA